MIPYGRQSIDQDDIDAVVASLESDWLTQGPALQRFESALTDCTSAKFAVACNSGTAALHMAYAAAGIGPGDTVVVPANTFLATANAAIYLGAEVRFCDVDPDSGLMTPRALAAVLDASVSAVVPVHFAGQACDMAAIKALLDERCPAAHLIEDASHAIGGSYADGSPVGNLRYASMVTFSFHPVKHVAAGEGGAVTTDCPQLKERLERFRCHGMTKAPDQLHRPDEGPWYYEMHSPGYNFRIPEMSCALAASQMTKLKRFVARRREIAGQYLDQLADLEQVSLPAARDLPTSAWHLFCLHIDFDHLGVGRAEAMASLQDRGVGSQVHYYPVGLQPFYRERYRLADTQFPGAVRHYQRALSIPMYPAMTDADVQEVVTVVRSVVATSANVGRHVA